MMIEKTMPIQVDELEQPVAEEEGEKMQDQKLSQQVEKLIEATDMELEHEPHNEEINLMTRAPDVISQSPPPPVSEPILSEQGDIVLLDDDPIMDVYNQSFDEFQKNIV